MNKKDRALASVDSHVPQGTPCAFGFCAIRAFRVKNEYQYFGAEILNTESTDLTDSLPYTEYLKVQRTHRTFLLQLVN